MLFNCQAETGKAVVYMNKACMAEAADKTSALVSQAKGAAVGFATKDTQLSRRNTGQT